MAYNDALKLVQAEFDAGAKFPVEYNIPVEGKPNTFYKVIVTAPPQTRELTEMRKRAMSREHGSLNFAPTSTCPLCGR